MKANSNLTLEEGFNQFIKMCKIKNLSPKTTETYEWHFLIFTRFIDKESQYIKSYKGGAIILYFRVHHNLKIILVNTSVKYGIAEN